MKFDFVKIITGVFGQCPPCIDTDNVPNYLCDPCDTTVYSGGIAGWVAKKCKYTFDDITDSAEWYDAIEAKDVFGRINGSRISGGLTAPDFTTKKRGSCGQEEIVKQSRTVTLTDSENDADFSIDEMYNWLAIPAKHSGYEFGFVTCDGRFLGWFENVAVRAFYQIAETDEDDSYWTAEFRFNESLGNFKQQQLSFLLDLPANVCWVQSITCAGAGGATTVPDGGTLQIVATVNPTNATNPILNYTVTPGTGTATIDALTGLLTGTGVGTVTVTVSATDASGVTCTLEIEVV